MYEGHRFCAESLEKPDTVESIGKTKLEQEPGKKKKKKGTGDKAQDSGALHWADAFCLPHGLTRIHDFLFFLKS